MIQNIVATNSLFQFSKTIIIIVSLMICMLILMNPIELYAVNNITQDTTNYIDSLENFIFNTTKSGSLIQRIDNIELNLFGKKTSHSLAKRVQTAYKFVFEGNDSMPSLQTKLLYLEWKLFNETRSGKLSERLDALETFLTGYKFSEPLAFRIEQLLQLTLANGIISVHPTILYANTSIKAKLLKTISSKESISGEIVPIVTTADVVLNGNILVIPKGTLANARIEKVSRGKRFGRSGYIKLVLDNILAIDGKKVPVKIVSIGDELDKKRLGMAAGASAVGYFIMGPLGLVGGAFVKGEDVTLQENTVINLLVDSDTRVNGILISR